MKRIFILLAVLLISTITLTAEIKSLSSDSFEIKGYKITGSGDVEFIITDAISESLNTFQQSNTSGGDVSVPVGEINATSHIDSFLSDSAEISGGNVDNIIFSYRLVASDDVTYNIKFSITPFIEQNTIDVSSASIIDAAFRTAHHNTVYSDGTQDFPQANAGGTADGNPPDAGSTAAGSPSDPDDPSTNQNHKEAELKDSISPASGNVRQWIFRGAVLMAVSQKDFDRAPTGEYRATVKATLTTN